MSWWPGSGRATRTGASGSSTTSSRTSTSSSTSDRLGGFLRLIHPFPSLLDGVVVVAVALVAGAQMASAVLLGVSMTALQASIGSLNDRIDARRDAGQKVGKPIPAGLVTSAQAGAVAAGAAAVGVSLAASVSLGLTGLALIVLAIGYGYDVWAKGTAWSWVPFAVGIPLLPVYGWFG